MQAKCWIGNPAWNTLTYVFNCRTKLEKLLCLKCWGRRSLANSAGFQTTKLHSSPEHISVRKHLHGHGKVDKAEITVWHSRQYTCDRWTTKRWWDQFQGRPLSRTCDCQMNLINLPPIRAGTQAYKVLELGRTSCLRMAVAQQQTEQVGEEEEAGETLNFFL